MNNIEKIRAERIKLEKENDLLTKEIESKLKAINKEINNNIKLMKGNK